MVRKVAPEGAERVGSPISQLKDDLSLVVEDEHPEFVLVLLAVGCWCLKVPGVGDPYCDAPVLDASAINVGLYFVAVRIAKRVRGVAIAD